MTRFRFKLDRLRRVRKLQEEEHREVWLRAELVRREAESAEQAARGALRAAEEELRARQADGALGVAGVLQAQDALVRAQAAVRRARERTRTAASQADRLRAPWEERRKDVRGLERLEEEARARWRREELRREAAELDEVASQERPSLLPTGVRPIRETREGGPAAAAGQPPLATRGPGPAPQGPRPTDRSTEDPRS